MNLNKVIIVLIISFYALGCYAKKKEYPKADIKVSYNYHKIFLRGSDGVVEQDIPFILLANAMESKFYSPHTEYMDSMLATPKGKAVSKELLHTAIRRYVDTKDRSVMESVTYRTHLYVFKSKSENLYNVYDYVSMQGHFHYQEPLTEIEWSISDSTKNILGYECFMAEADYHGRSWTVWFTPEIPISDGPWKLQGVPGLILEASEPSGQHTFTATGIEYSNQAIVGIYDPKRYDKSSRIEMLKMERYYRNNSNSILKAQLDLEISADSPLSEESKKYDFIETDYH